MPEATKPKYTKPEVVDVLPELREAMEPRLFVAPEAETDEPTENLSLVERFIMAPFSVLDARQGAWKDRKRQWLSLGLRSELGRSVRMSAGGAKPDVLHIDAESGEVYEHAAAPGTVNAQMLAIANGQSVFDPVLCELAYQWFCPPGGRVLDPWAGGSVRGLVAGVLGRQYDGIDLRAEQVEANDDQAAEWVGRGLLSPADMPNWYQGDSYDMLTDLDEGGAHSGPYDFIFGCPPYFDLEQYSEDPADLSNMDDDEFAWRYGETIRGCVERMAEDRFAALVVSQVREPRPAHGYYRDLVGLTIAAFEQADAHYYNELILVAPVGTVRLRAAKQFLVSRKVARVHQTMLVFVKGDPYKAAAAIGNGNTMGVPSEVLDAEPDEEGADDMSQQEVGN